MAKNNQNCQKSTLNIGILSDIYVSISSWISISTQIKNDIWSGWDFLLGCWVFYDVRATTLRFERVKKQSKEAFQILLHDLFTILICITIWHCGLFWALRLQKSVAGNSLFSSSVFCWFKFQVSIVCAPPPHLPETTLRDACSARVTIYITSAL